MINSDLTLNRMNEYLANPRSSPIVQVVQPALLSNQIQQTQAFLDNTIDQQVKLKRLSTMVALSLQTDSRAVVNWYMGKSTHRPMYALESKDKQITAAVEVIASAVGVGVWAVAALVLSLIAKVFVFMVKFTWKVYKRYNAIKTKRDTFTKRYKKHNPYASDTTPITLNASTWKHANKVPKLLAGKTQEVQLTRAQLGTALINEWMVPKFNKYTTMWVNNPKDYKRVIKLANDTAPAIDNYFNGMNKTVASLIKVVVGRADVKDVVDDVTNIKTYSDTLSQTLSQINTITDKYDGVAITASAADIEVSLDLYDYAPPKQIKRLEGRIRAFETLLKQLDKALNANKDRVPQDTLQLVNTGCALLRKVVTQIHGYNVTLTKVYNDITSSITQLVEYMNIILSVETA